MLARAHKLGSDLLMYHQDKQAIQEPEARELGAELHVLSTSPLPEVSKGPEDSAYHAYVLGPVPPAVGNRGLRAWEADTISSL